MDKDEIKKIVLDAIDSGAIQYTLEPATPAIAR